MHVKKIAKDLLHANLEVVRRMGLLYDNKGGEGKKKGYEKNALECLLTPARDTTRHMPRLHAKMASVVKTLYFIRLNSNT